MEVELIFEAWVGVRASVEEPAVVGVAGDWLVLGVEDSIGRGGEIDGVGVVLVLVLGS